jgi:hypothetical protein
MKYLIAFLLFINSFELVAQIQKSSFINSKKDIPYKIVVGELRGMNGVYDAYLKIINQQSIEFPYHLILERDASFCFFINLHLSGADTNTLKYIRFSNTEEKEFYKKLYTLNLQRIPKNKISVKSFDLEYHNNFQTTINALYYMIAAVSNHKLQAVADSIYKNPNRENYLKATDLIRLIDTTRLADLMVHDSVLQLIKNNLKISLSFGKPYTNDWYKSREKVLLNYYYKASFNLDRYCAIIQTKHLPKAGDRNAFLKNAELKSLGITCVYPIYFNRYVNTIFKKPFYCEHPKNPFYLNKKSTVEFSKKKGAWLISSKKTYYLIVSN